MEYPITLRFLPDEDIKIVDNVYNTVLNSEFIKRSLMFDKGKTGNLEQNQVDISTNIISPENFVEIYRIYEEWLGRGKSNMTVGDVEFLTNEKKALDFLQITIPYEYITTPKILNFDDQIYQYEVYYIFKHNNRTAFCYMNFYNSEEYEDVDDDVDYKKIEYWTFFEITGEPPEKFPPDFDVSSYKTIGTKLLDGCGDNESYSDIMFSYTKQFSGYCSNEELVWSVNKDDARYIILTLGNVKITLPAYLCIRHKRVP